MCEGAQWMLYLSSDLAYGMVRPTIVLSSVLVYKVELFEVKPVK